MRVLRLAALLSSCSLLVLVSCGSGRNASVSGSALPGPQGLPSIMPGSIEARLDSFELRVLDSSYEYGGSASYELTLEAAELGQELVVRAEARDLRACQLELAYDPLRWHVGSYSSPDWPGVDGSELLNMTITGYAGMIYHGSVLTHLDQRPGVNGSLEVLRVRFLPGAAPEAPRLAR